MSMLRSSRPLFILIVLFLSGCAFAPGLHFDSTSQTASSASADTPPPGALINITPDLIRQQRTQEAGISDGVKHLFGTAAPYTIGPADVVNIVVWNHPELVLAPAGATLTTDASGLAVVGNGYNVSPDGLIQFPLLGTFKIAGLTEDQAREELTRRLAKYLRDPQVTVRVQAYRAGRVYVDGEVKTPGVQAINDIPMTLPEAINRAGGLTKLADRATVDVTRHGTTTVVNMPQLARLGINPSRILLHAGDLVRVGSRDDSRVYVMGEVTKPVAQPLNSNGRLTLNDALGEAGGVSTTSGDPRQIYVVRNVPDGKPEIYHLDAASPVAYALTNGFELKAHDVVYVDAAPLVRWNRVISLILPTAESAYYATITRASVNVNP
ncbi:MAG: Putative polysaccharide export protein YccZ precursor [Burkholderiaceae bacterium]|nr:MAG: Putative polysaccharide export protein YccZ precursor [Burkholderiaceae bacterium]